MRCWLRQNYPRVDKCQVRHGQQRRHRPRGDGERDEVMKNTIYTNKIEDIPLLVI